MTQHPSDNPHVMVGIPMPAKTGPLRKAVKALLEEMGCDPFAVLANIAMGNSAALGVDEVPLDNRQDAAKELAGYLAPKLRSIEHVDASPNRGGVMLIPAPVSMDEWTKIVQEAKTKTIEADKVADA